MNTDQLFAKDDTSDDSLFYEIPRLVSHIDDKSCMVLKGYYRSLLKDGDAVLVLMSSWISHLSEGINYSKVIAQVMNKVELEANPQFTDFIVKNKIPTRSYPTRMKNLIYEPLQSQFSTSLHL